jgi:virulence factor Mce-like protein
MSTAGVTAERPRFSLEGVQQSKTGRAVFGVVLAVAVAALVWFIVSAFTGQFTNVVRIRAELPQGSNAVQVAAPVEYRNVTVGKIGSESPGPNGTVAVDFEIYPKNLPNIPKGVQAQVSPLSIFGNQYVNLVAPGSLGAGHLEAGDFVSPYTGAPSSSLQGTTTQLYGLLNAIHPADLDTALTALAEALNGEGRALGQTLSGTAKYLGTGVVPNLANVRSDIALLTPVNHELNASAPDVIATLGNSATTAQTITQQEVALHGLLTDGTKAVGQLGNVLQQVQTTLPELMNESGPLLADITQNPDELARTLSGLTTFAAAVAAQEQSGPFLSVNVALPVADISAGVNAALGYNNPASVDTALGAAVNPPTYTSANCPQYPGESNPYCGGGSPASQPAGGTVGTVTPLQAQSTSPAPAGATSTPAAGGPASDPASDLAAGAAQDPQAAQMQAAMAIATADNGGRAPAAPGLVAIILLPLLASMAHG